MTMTTTLPRVILSPKRAKPFYARHPWVYAGAVAAVEGEPADGAEVELVSHAGHFVARGLYNSKSKIRVRLYSWSAETALDIDFFRARLANAIALRAQTLGWSGPGQACRLVFSESDGLSGLTVDRYDRWLVMQLTGLGMAQRQELFAELLVELLQPTGIYVRTEKGIGALEGLALQDGPLWGKQPAGSLLIEEGGLKFEVNIASGQKTGFYLDQRDNRPAAARYAAGRRVLDAFCYTGGFGLHALRAGASSVVGIDASEAALELAVTNAKANDLAKRTRYERADVFDELQRLVQGGEQFGMVVLDPPKFARNRSAVEEALRGYRRLQTLALRLLPKDGILVTCCCSGLITQGMLDELLGQIGQEEKRDIQILERRGQAADHPIAAACPETSYLKCLISRVL
jgi:23S rRNA (cytosine1962-C5)-methyltransferase